MNQFQQGENLISAPIDTGSTKSPNTYQSYSLDHHGLVAGLYDDLGIGDHIDQLIPQDLEQRHVSLGTVVKAMIINGLGFNHRTLYLMPQFFQDKPIERLLGTGITAEHLNDDTLGRALDQIYQYNVTTLYTQLAIPVVQQLGLDNRTGHIDSTSFHYDGYANSDHPPSEDDNIIHITKGYSRDHRPDLNQVSLQLIVEQQAGIPLLMRSISGNEVDSKAFNETFEGHIDQLKEKLPLTYITGDAALYTKDNIQCLSPDYYWVSRVPESLSLATKAIHENAEILAQQNQERTIACVESNYGDIQQRWLVIHTRAGKERAIETVSRHLLKLTTKEQKALDRLCRQTFSCEVDAINASEAFSKTLKATKLMDSRVNKSPYYLTKGRPKKDQKPDGYHYRIAGQIASLPSEYKRCVERKSCFILATNQCNETELSDEDLIKTYKNQQKVERGFRFLKDPLFHAATLYLKSPKRIMALMMIMTLCLLVYAALEYRIRQALAKEGQTFPTQTGKETQKPTARWVFQFFRGIHLLVVQEVSMRVLNLNEHHLRLLRLLGKPYEDFYSNE
jgi:transposase